MTKSTLYTQAHVHRSAQWKTSSEIATSDRLYKIQTKLRRNIQYELTCTCILLNGTISNGLLAIPFCKFFGPLPILGTVKLPTKTWYADCDRPRQSCCHLLKVLKKRAATSNLVQVLANWPAASRGPSATAELLNDYVVPAYKRCLSENAEVNISV